VTLNESDTPVLRIAQITDTHLYADPAGELLGLNTRQCLQEVVALAATRSPQLVVATGDLTHDGSKIGYQQLQRYFTRLQVPVYCLPGNHDEANSLKDSMNGALCHAISSVLVSGWQLAFVNSAIQGSDVGHLSSQELAKLDAALAQAPEHPSIVWLHHQPVPVGSRWLDTMAVDNADDFFRIIDRHPQVRAIVWGHVHQCFEHRHRDIILLASPSTCIQFLPNSEEFAIDLVPPGFRWFDLYGDGHFTTGVERLAAIPGAIDLTARGY
jgi:Icc protein